MGKKTELATLGEPMTKAESRAAMAEARRRVRNMLKGKNPEGFAHMGEMPTSYDDAIRIIIALQDECEAEKTAHNKATNHIGDLLHDREAMSESLNEAAMQSMMSEVMVGECVQSLRDEVNLWKKRAEDIRTYLDQTMEEKRVVSKEIFKLRQEKEALLQTLKMFSQGRA